MSNWQNDTMLDLSLNWIKNNATEMIACSQQPTTYAEATSTYALADVVMAPGDFTLADGDTSGRKLTVAQKLNVDVDVTGTANHIALVGTSASPDLSADTLMYVVTCNSVSITTGRQVTFVERDIELRDSTS